MHRPKARKFLAIAAAALFVATLPATVLAATSGTRTVTFSVPFVIRSAIGADSNGNATETMKYSWSDPNPSPQGTGPLANQTGSCTNPGGSTSITKTWDNHNLIFSTWDYSYQMNCTFNKSFGCAFHLNIEIQVDGNDGKAQGKVRDAYASGIACSGWGIYPTPTAGSTTPL